MGGSKLYISILIGVFTKRNESFFMGGGGVDMLRGYLQIGLFWGVISIHFRAFLRPRCRMGMFFGDHKISSVFFYSRGGGVCLIFLFLGGRGEQ